jgi:hypothetical protein
MSPFSSAVGTLAIVNVAWLSSWFWSGLYFREHSVLGGTAVLATNAVMLAVVLVVTARMTSKAIVSSWAISLLVALSCYFCLRAAAGLLVPIGPISKTVVIGLSGAVGLIVRRRLSTDQQAALLRGAVFASCAFLVTPLFWQFVAPKHRAWSPINHQVFGAQPDSATVVLLLDELSSAAADPVEAAVRSKGLSWARQSIRPAGKSTINAIPVMLTGEDFAQASPCGWAAICSGSSILDFSSVTAQRPDIDVVGLYHPYCAIHGLRYCHEFRLPSGQGTGLYSLGAEYLRRLGIRTPNRWLVPGRAASDSHRDVVERQIDAMYSAPFWDKGGVLFAHLALPHPPGLNHTGDLGSEYDQNISATASLVGATIDRLSRSFGVNFRILITSDHPLRGDWCGYAYYADSSCRVRPEFYYDQVPVIVASPVAVKFREPLSSKRIFSILHANAPAR